MSVKRLKHYKSIFLCYLKGYSGFKNQFSWLSLFGFKIIFDQIKSSHSEYWLSGSFLNSDKMQLNVYQVINFMILFFVIYYALQNRKFNISLGTYGEHCSKRNATAKHQNKGFYSSNHWLICLTYIYYV